MKKQTDQFMSQISLHKPIFEELTFRQHLMADEKTMSYNHAYGGTIEFPKERWKSWYERWLDDTSGKRFYRYLKEEETGQFVGEVAYHFDEEQGNYICDVIVLDQFRGNGYGKQGLQLLCKAAKVNGLDGIYDEIAINNLSVQLFLKNGFMEVERTEDTVVVMKNL